MATLTIRNTRELSNTLWEGLLLSESRIQTSLIKEKPHSRYEVIFSQLNSLFFSLKIDRCTAKNKHALREQLRRYGVLEVNELSKRIARLYILEEKAISSIHDTSRKSLFSSPHVQTIFSESSFPQILSSELYGIICSYLSWDDSFIQQLDFLFTCKERFQLVKHQLASISTLTWKEIKTYRALLVFLQKPSLEKITEFDVLACCKHLNILDLSDSDIDDARLLAIPTHCFATLTRLSLDGCSKLTDAAVISVIENCPLLTDFSANGCNALTDTTVIAAVKCCPLSKLSLGFCQEVTDIALRNIREDFL